MSFTDPIGDLLARIKNAYRNRVMSVVAPYSKLRCGVLDVLVREGFISNYEVEPVRAGIQNIMIYLRYFDNDPVIKQLKRVSKPGRRVYYKANELPRIFNGLGISVVSTPRGVLSDSEARAANVGGELLCSVF